MSAINTGAFIGVGISVNYKELNKLFARCNKFVLDAEYSIVTEMASNLVDFSPVWTGRYVKNWDVNPNFPSKRRDQEKLGSGASRRKQKMSPGEAVALKESKKQYMIDRIVQSLETQRTNSMQQGTYGMFYKPTKMNTSWFFTNTTPYADAVESRHGVVAGAEVAGHTSISFAKMDSRQI